MNREIHCVLATVLDQNLGFRNCLNCVLGKEGSCMMCLFEVGRGKGAREDVGEESFIVCLE